MGKEASVSQLKEYWILPVFNLAFTLLALLYAWIGVRFLRLPNWLFPAAAFPNTLSLPLLLLESLSKTGAVDELLMGKKDTVEAALGRGKTYMLVNVSSLAFVTPQRKKLTIAISDLRCLSVTD